MVKVLCGNSGDDVDWLVEKFDLDLSLLARLGGNSAPRTHRGKERFPGMTITCALIQMLEKVAEKTDRARIITKARGHTSFMNPSSNTCIGLSTCGHGHLYWGARLGGRTTGPQNNKGGEQHALRTTGPQKKRPSEQPALRTRCAQNNKPSEQQALRTTGAHNNRRSVCKWAGGVCKCRGDAQKRPFGPRERFFCKSAQVAGPQKAPKGTQRGVCKSKGGVCK